MPPAGINHLPRRITTPNNPKETKLWNYSAYTSPAPGTKTKRSSNKAYNYQLRDKLDRNQAAYDRLERQHEELKRDIDFERAQYGGLQELHADLRVEHEGVKAELERLQELAPRRGKRSGPRAMPNHLPAMDKDAGVGSLPAPTTP